MGAGKIMARYFSRINSNILYRVSGEKVERLLSDGLWHMSYLKLYNLKEWFDSLTEEEYEIRYMLRELKK
jgi:hypothetical protein